jgi:protoheme IX farnesyltransferase
MQTALSYSGLIRTKVRDYAQLVKFRLAITVVFSAVIAYALATYGVINWANIILLALGGFFITGSANALNQIIEKDHDRVMDRTKNRPLAAGRMSVVEAIIAAGLMGVAGKVILWASFNITAAMLGSLSLLVYAFIYTPLKRVSPAAVFVGAIPGALPPMIGWVAYTGVVGVEALLIFSIQFIWQFPHFWAIAWVMDDDYKKAGFRLLPSAAGRDKSTAFQTMMYCLILIPVCMLPAKLGMTGSVSMYVVLGAGLFFLWQSIKLYRNLDMRSAKHLMYGSFLYLPVVLLAYIFDKI